MIDLPPKFKQALGSGVRTSLYPIVRIYKDIQIDNSIEDATDIVNLSIKETNISGSAYKPLLLSSPSIKSSADIINNKYTISSVSLSISNAPFQGKIFSDDIQNLLNAVTQVYYCANGIDSIDDCLLVYTGTIRRYTQSSETVQLKLEDLTEQKLKTKIPSTLIEDEDNYADEHIGTPYPMAYGYVDKSPLVLNKKDSLTIDKPNIEIGGIWDNVSKVNFKNNFVNDQHPLVAGVGWLKKKSFLYTYNNGYMPIMEEIPYNFGSRSYTFYEDTMYEYQHMTVGNSAQINLHTNNFLYEQYTEDSDGNIVGKGKVGIPTRIYRPVKKIDFFATNKGPSIQDQFPYQYWHAGASNQFFGFGDTLNHEATKDIETIAAYDPDINNNYSLANSNYDVDWSPYGPYIWWKPTELNLLSGTDDEDGTFDNKDVNYEVWGKNPYFPVQWIQNNNNTSGLHIDAQAINGFGCGGFAQLQLYEDVGEYPCVTKILYKIDYFVPSNISTTYVQDHLAEPSAFWVERNLINRKRNENDSFSDMVTTINDWEEYYLLEDWTTACEVPNHEHTHESDETQFRYTHDSLVGNGFDNIILGFDTTNGTESIQWGLPSLFTSESDYGIASCIANLKQFYTLQDVLVVEYPKEKFFGAIKGRIVEDEVMTKPHFILDNILKEELAYEKSIILPDEQIDDNWINSFSMNKQKEAKSIIDGLFKSSIYIPSFDSGGNFKFIDLKQNIEDYSQFKVIDNQNIIKYSFGLTKLEDIKNQINIKYKKDYGSDEFTEQTGYGIESNKQIKRDTLDDLTKELTPNMPYNIFYYGMKDEDAKLEIETEYIRDKDTAKKLQRRLLMWYANQHLTMKLDLPVNYIHLESGDYIRFEELIGGKLAFGFDYTKEFIKNGQLIYPVFFVTKIFKSLSKVSLELVQVHRGDFGISDSDLGDYLIPDPYNNQLFQPIPDEDADYFEAVWYDDNNSLERGNICPIVNTNFETGIDIDIKLIYSSHDFTYRGISVVEGSNDVDANDGVDPLIYVEISETDSLYGDNVQLNPLLNFKLETSDLPGGWNEEPIDLKFTILISSTVNNSYNESLTFSQRLVPRLSFGHGDLNSDGVVNILDVVILLNLILDGGDYNQMGDINGDGGLNILDIVQLVDIITGS